MRQRHAASGSTLPTVVSSLTFIQAIGDRSNLLETHGPFATLWVGLGLCAFYIALVWINTLLGVVLTPLFIIPLTWLQDRVLGKTPVRG
jgi:hypothetical protein